MQAWKATWAVSLDGRDISSAMNPYLQSIEVTDKDGTASDTCALILDDSNGQFRMPRAGGSIAVRLEGVEVFQGTIDEINSAGGRGQGRLLSINAKGFDTRGKVKSRLDFHLDNATLQQFADEAARRAGIDRVIIDPAYAATRRDYWSADGESFVHLMERISREYGGSFKIRQDRAVLAQRGTGLSPSGKPMASMTATWGEGGNLLSWDISPYVARHRGKRAKVKFYDRKTGRHETREVEIESGNGDDEVAAVNAAVARVGGGAQRTYSAEEMMAIREAFHATGPAGPDPYAPWQLVLANAALGSPIATLQRILGVTGSSEPRGRTYSPEEMAAIEAAFDAPQDPATRTYSAEEMAKIRAAFEAPEVTLAPVYSAADADGAEVAAKGKKSDSQRKSGEGSVTVTLMPEARVEGTLIVRGARPGVDGAYRIGGVSHKVERSGSVTTLELKQPGSGTGSGGDDRRAWSEEQSRANLLLRGTNDAGPGGLGQG